MKRLGRFTGKVYDEKESLRIEECCDVISDAQANNKAWIASKHEKDFEKCKGCMACKEAKKHKEAV